MTCEPEHIALLACIQEATESGKQPSWTLKEVTPGILVELVWSTDLADPPRTIDNGGQNGSVSAEHWFRNGDKNGFLLHSEEEVSVPWKNSERLLQDPQWELSLRLALDITQPQDPLFSSSLECDGVM